MKKHIILAIAGALAILSQAGSVRAAGCGMQPLKPLVPLGCRDLVAMCNCDASAQRCSWQWQCVR